jgi:hypothetical protein
LHGVLLLDSGSLLRRAMLIGVCQQLLRRPQCQAGKDTVAQQAATHGTGRVLQFTGKAFSHGETSRDSLLGVVLIAASAVISTAGGSL